MIFIYDQILTAENLKKILELNLNMTAKEIMKFLISEESYKDFYNEEKIEYDYKITVTSEENLRIILEFFSKYQLSSNEFLAIKRYKMSLKETYEIIKEYEKTNITEHIYVEQFDKNEYISFKNYTIIYKFLKKFYDSLPENPSDLDIVINAYDYVKDKEYFREDDDSSLISKMFSTSIITPYIVCAGFVKQFNCILKEYNIPCYNYQFKDNPKEGHIVSLVNLENMGVYFFDITRDSYNREKTTLDNKANYSGFMLPFTEYSNIKLNNDNFDKQLFRKKGILELNKKYAIQEIDGKKDIKINVFDENEYDFANLFSTIVDTSLELIKDKDFFITVPETLQKANKGIYNALIIINEYFGKEITDPEFFIKMIIHAKGITNIERSKEYIIKSLISRFSGKDSINLSEAVKVLDEMIKKEKFPDKTR